MLKKTYVPVTELGSWLGYSRQSIYRFRKAYEIGDYDSINPDVLKVFKFMDANQNATGSDVKNFIMNELHIDIDNTVKGSILIDKTDVMEIKRLAFMGRVLDNPNASYENISYLTPLDKLQNGAPVEDHSDELSKDEMIESIDRLRAFKLIHDAAKQYTRNKLSGKRVWFSDSQRSFITEFNTPGEPDHPFVHDYTEARVVLEVIAEILGQSSFSRCPIVAVSTLKDRVDEAVDSLKTIENTKYPDDFGKIRKEVKEINNEWAVRNKVINNGWYECVAIIAHMDAEGDHIDLFFDENTGTSIEDVALALKHSVVEEYQNNFFIKGMAFFGPFSTIDEAERISEYLSIEWDVDFGEDADVSEEDALKWLEKQKKKSKVLNGGIPINQ